ncbi:glucose 1-dehydrogenase [Cellulomonas composti]|uniref:3-alpha-(Or 20-beta)-hydroxysteroid dehydrogenase n=1 Tax=Cellulomonas composti TaxID=266130 RepID=A0A511JE05_9CELL|nr:glucose 1-dehydrogenase [Cellulomonas composti]GEL96228.1 3-alpha-(or 20-beta)-hydroxysteroid dehydrogenase [Cellulomonas composti]
MTSIEGRLEGKVAIVTGGARGMGEADTRRLVAEGARVVVGDVLDEPGAAVAAELGDHAVYTHLDVTDEASWAAAVDLAHERFGPVDVLVNNAGILAQGRIDETEPDTFRRVLDVNLTGVYLGIRAVTADMAAAGHGAIVNISSAAGLVGMQGLSAYSASKWGVRGLTKCAALDLGHLGIRVNSIHPGAIRTPMAAGVTDEAMAHQALPRVGEPSEIAAAVAFLVSDDASDVTGAELAVDGGMVLGVVA